MGAVSASGAGFSAALCAHLQGFSRVVMPAALLRKFKGYGAKQARRADDNRTTDPGTALNRPQIDPG